MNNEHSTPGGDTVAAMLYGQGAQALKKLDAITTALNEVAINTRAALDAIEGQVTKIAEMLGDINDRLSAAGEGGGEE